MDVRTRMFSRALACALFTGLAVAGGAPARADVLTVTAKGTIQPSCAITATQLFPASNFNTSGSAVAKANVKCNQFFKINASSQKGAIKSADAVSPPFSNAVPYSLKADVVLDNNSTQTATCAAATLVAGQSSCTLSPANSTGLTSNGQIATDKTTTLTVNWTPPPFPTLMKPGSYSDTITLTIATVP